MLQVFFILLPMFIGFCFPKNDRLAHVTHHIMHAIVLMIILIIGFELAHISLDAKNAAHLLKTLLLLVVASLSSGMIALYVFEKLSTPIDTGPKNSAKGSSAFLGSMLQLFCLAGGFLLAKYAHRHGLDFALPEHTTTILLMALLFLVGASLKNSGLSFKQAMLNTHGIYISLVFMVCTLLSAFVLTVLMDMPIFMALSLVSGFGWYSLSGGLISQYFGAGLGSIALLNDLIREIFALLFIPYIAKSSPKTAIGVAGVTALDFCLPIIKKSTGDNILPVAISFGLITNIISPILMVFFAQMAVR